MFQTNDRIETASLERIIPDETRAGEVTGSESLRLHLERYEFASRNLVTGSVLDIACGSGYGTALLSENSRITHAVGVDISSAAVQYSIQRYGGGRVSYECSDALEFSPQQRFENVVSLETIEHVDDPRALFAHLVSLTAPEGRLIASVPVTPSVDANPHHKTNFSVQSFRRMGDAFSLKHVASFSQVQPFSPLTIVARKEARARNLRRDLGWFYLRNPSHLCLRVWSTLRDGFVNKYLTVVWQK